MSKKISEMPEKLSMVDGDFFTIVDSQDASPVTQNKKIRRSNAGVQPAAPLGNQLGVSGGWTPAGDSATRSVGTGSGDVAAGDAPVAAVTGHETTFAHANLPTTAQKSAMDAANAPSGANAFATLDDILPAGGAVDSVSGSNSITAAPTTGDVVVGLQGDQANPGNNKVYGTDGAGIKGWKDDPSGGGGGGLTSVEVSADADITGVAGNHYIVDASGWTADRIITFPQGSLDDKIKVTLDNASTLFALIIKGATGVLIERGLAATEWSRLIISGESITGEITEATANNWTITADARILINTVVDSNAGTLWPDNVLTIPDIDTVLSDNANVADLANNGFKVRRSGTYFISNAIVTAQDFVEGEIYSAIIQIRGDVAGNILPARVPLVATAAGTAGFGFTASFSVTVADNYVFTQSAQYSGISSSFRATNGYQMALTEQL